MGYLDNTGLAYFWEKIKSNFFPATKEIPENADLNDYTTPGVYNCTTTAIAETLTNSPTEVAFSLQVYRTTVNGYRQVVMSYPCTDTAENTNRVWTRASYNADWGSWCQLVTSLDRPVDYTSVGWTNANYASNCWYKIATFINNQNLNDRRAIFTVTDSYWDSGNAPNGRPDLKYGILRVHIRKNIGNAPIAAKLTWNLITGYNLNDFVLIYNPIDDDVELWTKVPNRYNYRTFNLIENGAVLGGNRYTFTVNPLEMYGRIIANTNGYTSYPTGDGYVTIASEVSVVEQPSRGLVDRGVTYTGKIGTRVSNANAFLAGKGVLEYYNSTSSISLANGAFTYPDDTTKRDAHILRLPWDNVGTSDGACYDSMLAVPNSNPVNSNGYPCSLGWRTGYGAGCAEQDADGNWIQTTYSDWYHLIDDRYTIDGVHVKKQHTTHYGVCSTAAATAVKTVDIPHFELVTGAYVIVTFTITNSAAVANLKLNVSNTGDKPIKYRNANLAAVGDLIANRPFLFVYDGTNWQLGIDINKNDDHYERLRTYYPIKAKSAITKQHVIVAGEDGLYFMLTSGSPFSIKYPPLYATSAISANAKSTSAYYFCYLDTAVITNEAAETLTLDKALYIKGHLNDTTFTPFAVKSLVCTEPTTEDGYQYLKLGVVKAASTSSDELRCQIEIEHPIYEYINGSFCLYEPKATNAEIDSIFD